MTMLHVRGRQRLGTSGDRRAVYRVEENVSQRAGYDITGEWVATHVYDIDIEVFEYPIERETPKGYWIDDGRDRGTPNKWRLVLKGGSKRFACDTIEKAWESFRARKGRQASILAHQLRCAERARSLAEGQPNEESTGRIQAPLESFHGL